MAYGDVSVSSDFSVKNSGTITVLSVTSGHLGYVSAADGIVWSNTGFTSSQIVWSVNGTPAAPLNLVGSVALLQNALIPIGTPFYGNSFTVQTIDPNHKITAGKVRVSYMVI